MLVKQTSTSDTLKNTDNRDVITKLSSAVDAKPSLMEQHLQQIN